MPWIWMIAGILLSACAQLTLKLISVLPLWSGRWLAGIAVSICLYSMSFVAYSIVLRYYKISVAGPLMTVGVVSVVVLGGLLLGEALTMRQWMGMALTFVAVWLLLG